MQICGNRISNCVTRGLDEAMKKETSLPFQDMPCRGFGGILLSWCEKLTIKDNRIEGNGHSLVDPVCGIFILFASEVQIVQNYIFNNPPTGLSLTGILDPGPRGGIVLVIELWKAYHTQESSSLRIMVPVLMTTW